MKKPSRVFGLLLALIAVIGCDPLPQADTETADAGSAAESSNVETPTNETSSSGNTAGGIARMAAGSGINLDVTSGSDEGQPVVGTGGGTSDVDRGATADNVRVPADVGVGRKGRKTQENAKAGGIKQMIAQPVASLFAFRERAVFKIQIPHAMNLYKATNGYFPKSNDVFMKDIIKFNQIKLPELPFGQSYEYDAESAQLMVIRPLTD
jgi:hypothetical protein